MVNIGRICVNVWAMSTMFECYEAGNEASQQRSLQEREHEEIGCDVHNIIAI